MSAIEVVLFDLGGVLFDFAGVGPMKELSGIDDDGELWRRWLTCEWVRRFERGHCSAEQFATGVVDDWELALDPDEFLTEFRSWPAGPLAGAEALLAEVRGRMPAGCLSNTNILHWEDQFSLWPILDSFDYRLLSFELGFVKPDRDLFDEVARRVPVPPNRILFLDDNVINVEGARAAGFVAEPVRGVAEARAALAEAGIVERYDSGT